MAVQRPPATYRKAIQFTAICAAAFWVFLFWRESRMPPAVPLHLSTILIFVVPALMAYLLVVGLGRAVWILITILRD